MGTGRPSKCYRKQKQKVYSRKEYIKRYPLLPEGLKKCSFGNTKKPDFLAKVSLVSREDGQISAKALDTVRVVINRELKVLGEKNYRFQVKSYPFHIVRMHGLIGVAKAERIAKGMKQSFGSSQYRMSRVQKGSVLLEASINDDAVAFGIAKMAFEKAIKKLPLSWQIKVEGISMTNLLARPLLPKRTKEKKGGRTITERELPQPQVGK